MNDIRHFPAGARIAVLTAAPINRLLTYRAPEGGCLLGAYVEVPLGPRKIIGVVWESGENDFDATKIRSVISVLDIAPMRREMAEFLRRSGEYTLTPLSQMLRLATRAPGLGNPNAIRNVLHLTDKRPAKLTPAREQVIQQFLDSSDAAFFPKELADLAEVSPSVVKGLIKIGTLREIPTPRDVPYPKLTLTRPGNVLNDEQKAAADILSQNVLTGRYGTTLLRGVTGAGKTEVYLEAIKACLKQGRQALVLLPEIALSSQFISRVEQRFGAKPAQWHSGVTMSERRRCWHMIAQGRAELVVGARSALFLPFRDLGLIVVDEEHDSSYKQEDGVLYSARDMAVLRGSICDAHVVLASATPSLETWSNAQHGKYERIDLTRRFGAAVMPEMRVIDMRQEQLPAQSWLSPSLKEAIVSRLNKNEQTLLFINRRGYAPVTICRACGHQLDCPNCDAKLVEHRFQKRLICHQCGDSKPIPDTCPSCAAEGKLAPVGPGVERLAEEVRASFPDAETALLSSDLFASARALKQQIEHIAAGGADIIIGTQLVAKGHNFPRLTLVGVIDADLGLQGADLRAGERSFQLIRQVAGRAGRVSEKGLALLQSFQPEHPVIRAILSGEEENFWRAEADERQAAGVPPYGRLAGVILSSSDLQNLFSLGNDMARRVDPLTRIGAQVFGPAPAPIARIRGRHRIRLLIKADKNVAFQGAIKQWLRQFKPIGDTRIAIDIDPQSFF